MTIHDFSNRTLDSRYTLVRRIGYGGMATVYEGMDHQIDKRVAVKVLNPELTVNDEHMARFRQEARAAARIRHPHLVDVTDQGYTQDGLAYFVMEFLEGESLGEYIHRTGGPSPWTLAVEMIVQVCDALEVAHERGVIHRDIKPGNCFLEHRKGTGEIVFVKVLDLGIAKVRHDERDPRAPPSTRDSQGVPGTPEYMAPELARGVPYDRRVDIYALGIVMYRLLTGELPFFSAASAFATLEMHCNKPARPPRELNPTIPEWLERVVMTAMAKNPDERWATAGELAAALRSGREVRPEPRLVEDVHTQQYTRAPPLPTTARRLFVGSTILGGLTTAAAMFLVLMLFEGPGQGAPPTAPPARTADRGTTLVEESRAVAQAEPGVPVAQVPVPDPEPAVDGPPEIAAGTVHAVPPDVENADAGEAPGVPEPQVAVEPETGSGERGDPGTPTVKEREAVPRDPAAADTNMFNKTFARRRGAIAKACSDKIGMFEDQVKIDMLITLDDRGTITNVVLHRDYAAVSVGKCVQAEVEKLKFAALGSAQRVFKASITIKGKKK